MTKETQQGTFELISAASTSSTALSLQQLKKAEEKEAAEEAVKVRCRTCFKEIAPIPRCFGHGGGGGAGGAEADPEAKEAVSGEIELIKIKALVDTDEDLEEDLGFHSENQLSNESFDPELITEMIEDGLLLVDNDRKSMTLTISLQCKPEALSEKQREALKKFIAAIAKEFNAFKKDHHLYDCLEKNNVFSLRISLPTLKLYDEFIKRLANNLVPAPSLRLNEEVKADEADEEEIFNPSPFSTAFKPW
ncbi:hypothetical protein Lbir_1678 [Legionella birminghamensis]|uniref:Uncharacterized protein n=1 Tax=Legionella birminghamensis TaxID=28083 RepID=A0A378I7W2_9GAMM|nr:hypothetical protein [Legionella birminghamensis]KTC71526.1 hypothetical protein Lbir_1678 [Legionella birminghamensis]STX30866.1 Uncharacterised protein [Legionella birminghamensis]